MPEPELAFKVTENGKNTSPVWVEVRKTDGDRCPKCGGRMVVMFGPNQLLYAFCFRCVKYFVGE